MQGVNDLKEVVSSSVPTSEVQYSARKKKRNVPRAHVHIQSTYNNTKVTFTDTMGAVLAWSSAGTIGFKGAKKSTPYAAAQVVKDAAEKAKKYGITELEVFVKGAGAGREGAVRALAGIGFSIAAIKDVTPIAHNGCRPPRPRRI